MSPIREETTLQDVCFAVCSALQRAGTVAVLTGGSAATYYAPESYQSLDADFVISFSADGVRAADAMRSLGYSERGGIYFHELNRFTVEFPPGPLAVGNDLIQSYATVRRDDELLHVLSRTDCVRDRLSSFYYFTDRSALAAAIAVALSGPIDLDSIERWSLREGQGSRFAEFRGSLSLR